MKKQLSKARNAPAKQTYFLSSNGRNYRAPELPPIPPHVSGWRVVGSDDQVGFVRAYFESIQPWGLTDVPLTAPFSSLDPSEFSFVSADGLRMAGRITLASTGVNVPFFWSEATGTLHILDHTLPPFNLVPSTFRGLFSMSDSGDAVFLTYGVDVAGLDQCFVWKPLENIFAAIPHSPDYLAAAYAYVSPDGSVVVGESSNTIIAPYNSGFVWSQTEGLWNFSAHIGSLVAALLTYDVAITQIAFHSSSHQALHADRRVCGMVYTSGAPNYLGWVLDDVDGFRLMPNNLGTINAGVRTNAVLISPDGTIVLGEQQSGATKNLAHWVVGSPSCTLIDNPATYPFGFVKRINNAGTFAVSEFRDPNALPHIPYHVFIHGLVPSNIATSLVDIGELPGFPNVRFLDLTPSDAIVVECFNSDYSLYKMGRWTASEGLVEIQFDASLVTMSNGT